MMAALQECHLVSLPLIGQSIEMVIDLHSPLIDCPALTGATRTLPVTSPLDSINCKPLSIDSYLTAAVIDCLREAN